MEKGIIIVAVAYSNYFRMAANLAISIKLNNPDTHITLLHDTKAMEGSRSDEKSYFDNFITIPDEYIFYDKRKAYGRLKCFIYDLSPYKKTIYIDADTLMLPNKNINLYWASIENQKSLWISKSDGIVSIFNSQKVSSWATLDYINNIFPDCTGKRILLDLQTSFIAFEKNNENKKIFDIAKKVFETLYKLDFKSDWYNTIPDELLFTIAMCKLDILPPDNDQYVGLIYQKPTSIALKNHYKFLSFASGMSYVPFTYLNIYNELIKDNAKKIALNNPYTWREKSIFIRKNSIIKRR